MRLLNTRSGEFKWVDKPEHVTYAILSHVWSPDGEQSYAELLQLQALVHAERAQQPVSAPPLPEDEVLRRASPKIRGACAYARAEGFDLIWIDSGCIDKTNSVELSEAINSMFRWYARATVCYVFLADVSAVDGDPRAPGSSFRRSRWFTRGWTLQELIAPRALVFCGADWETLGGKDGLADVVQEVAGIDAAVLAHDVELASVSVARRMSWAARRVTTRTEDEAYSLMGIFGVNMPTIYGEGRLAFVRLQEEILKEIPDQSIFVWENRGGAWATDFQHMENEHPRALLATSPADFVHSAHVRTISSYERFLPQGFHVPPPSYFVTAYGLRATFPILTLSPSTALALLACVTLDNDRIVALVLRRDPRSGLFVVGDSMHMDAGLWYKGPPDGGSDSNKPSHRPFWYPWKADNLEEDTAGHARLVCVAREPAWALKRLVGTNAPDFYPVDDLLADVKCSEVYIAHRPLLALSSRTVLRRSVWQPPSFPDTKPKYEFRIYVPEWSRLHLESIGYVFPFNTSAASRPSDPNQCHALTLIPQSGTPLPPIHLFIGSCDCPCLENRACGNQILSISLLGHDGTSIDTSASQTTLSDGTVLLDVADDIKVKKSMYDKAPACGSYAGNPHPPIRFGHISGRYIGRSVRLLLPHTDTEDTESDQHTNVDDTHAMDATGEHSATSAWDDVYVRSAVVTPMRLSAVRDFAGVPGYPAIFSICMEVSPPERRAALAQPE
ncbi:hypothetical protein C2E23DRAFT_882548 [Lenzites betulinus]|nr:hypothetical protein C2E23DRAFT_882548 [Lenzites betulinus]